MDTYFHQKLKSLASNSGLDKSEQDFFFFYLDKASVNNAEMIYISALKSDDRQNYFLSLVYGVKIKQYLDSVEYLDEKTKQNMLELEAGMLGHDSKKLYAEIIQGKGQNAENLDKIAEEVRSETSRVLDVARITFSTFIAGKSQEKDQLGIEKIRKQMEANC